MTTYTYAVAFTTQDIDPQDGVTPAGYQISMYLGTTLVETKAADSGSVEFTFSTPGTYTWQAARLTTSGENYAAPAISDPLVIAADKVSIPFKITFAQVAPVAVPASVAVAAG